MLFLWNEQGVHLNKTPVHETGFFAKFFQLDNPLISWNVLNSVFIIQTKQMTSNLGIHLPASRENPTR